MAAFLEEAQARVRSMVGRRCSLHDFHEKLGAFEGNLFGACSDFFLTADHFGKNSFDGYDEVR